LKPDVLKPDVLKPDILKPDVLWVYQEREVVKRNCRIEAGDRGVYKEGWV
jgi:hypothetical protein